MFHRCRVISQRGARFAVAALTLAVLLGLRPAVATSLSARDKIQELRAAFTYKFTAFVSWPEDDGNRAPFRVCVSADKEGIRAFESVSGRMVGKRKIEIVPLARDKAPMRCTILYISGETTDLTRALLAHLRKAPVLTIGETHDFAKDGGMIAIVPSGNRLGFEINLTAARQAGLQIRSQLLNLALHVY